MSMTHAMNSRFFFRALPPVALCAAALVPCILNGCAGEPATRCGIESSEAIALYTQTAGPKDLMPGACAALVMTQGGLPVDPAVSQADPTFLALGTELYLPSPADPNQDTEKRSMAIKAEWIGNRIQQAIAAGDTNYPYGSEGPPPSPPDEPTRVDRPYAWGTFDQFYPDSNGVCKATLAASDLPYPAINDANGKEIVPKTTVRYEWSNVRVIVNGSSVGQRILAHLILTQDYCQGEYDVDILAPRVNCNEYGPDGQLTGKGDESQCLPGATPDVPQPSAQQLYGSGLPSYLPLECKNLGGSGEGMSPAPDWECVPKH